MSEDGALRTYLSRLLDWTDAHVSFEAAVDGIEPSVRGAKPAGWDYSAWQLVEHIRLAQEDILAFCTAARYEERTWPDDFWPSLATPSSNAAWDAALDAYRRDRKTLQELTADPAIDLFALVPHGTTQTYLREILLVADHTAYHVGQLVALRKQLGIWPA